MGHYVRQLADSFAVHPVTLLAAPNGFGKSWLLKDFAASHPATIVTVAEGTSLARFTAEMVRALAAQAPGLVLTLAGAYERSLQTQDPAAALATWFVRHLDDVRGAIIVDDVHHATDPRVIRFLINAVERSPETVRWIISAQRMDDLPVASWLAHGLSTVPYDESRLRLTRDEARAIGERLGREADSGLIERTRRHAEGIVGNFTFLLRAHRDVLERELRTAGPFGAVLERAYASLKPPERDFVRRIALLPALDTAGLAYVAGEDAASTLLALRETAPQLFEEDGTRFHTCFEAFLRSLLAGCGEYDEVAAKTAGALEGSGKVAEALHLLASIRDETGIIRMIERHGLSSLESERSHELRDAIDMLSAASIEKSPTVLAVLGISAALERQTDVSEAFFQNALKFCETPHQRSRVRFLYGCELIRRARPDAIAMLRPDRDFFQTPRSLRVAMISALAAAYCVQGDAVLARKYLGRALRMADHIDDEVTRSRVYHQASYIALQYGEFERAKDFATRAWILAEKLGAQEVAGGALSVLYNVAADVDEDCRLAAEYLRRMAECGAKTGSIGKQQYALIAAYEMETERGDTSAIASVENDLREFDVEYSAQYANEGLVPSQALQLAWHGDFSRAYQLVRPSAAQQMDSERRALRWSEIAIYAAGAGKAREAIQALVKARRILKENKLDGARGWKTTLYCALTFVLLGRPGVGAALAAQTLEEIAPKRRRLLALAAAIVALAAWRSGEPDHGRLLNALDDLHARDMGGIARLLGALPLECTEPLSGRAALVKSA